MFVKKQREESAEASDPKTVCTGTRKCPASDVDAETAPDANAGRGASNGDNGASESKKSRVPVICEEVISEFDGARGGMKKEWDRASSEGRKLSTLMRDTDDWIQGKFKPESLEFMRVSGKDRSKAETKERYEELKKIVLEGMNRFDALRGLTRDCARLQVRGRSVGADERTD